MPKKTTTKPEDLFDSFLDEALTISLSQHNTSIGIVEFAEDIIFNGESKLYPPQRAILKAFYGEPLSEDELMILYDWKEGQEISRTTWVDGRQYSNLVLEAGRGSGKSTLIAIICLYEFYNLITLDNPAKHYGLLPGSPIAILAIAQSQDQVKETLFKAIRGYAENSKYFDSLVKKGTITIGVEEVRCEEKKVSIFAKHTNSKSLVGYSIKCLILDEAARFEIDELGNSKADGVWKNIGRGCRRFGRQGRKIAISSAWEPGDYIEKLYEVADKSIDTLGFRLKTWQVNWSDSNSEEAIKNSEDYINDPVASATEFEGIRTSSKGTFFISEFVKAAFKGYSSCDAKSKPIDETNEEGETRYYAGVEITRLLPLIDNVSFAHCDYGVKKDGAALAVCSPINTDNKWGISVDVLMMWKPYLDKDINEKGIKRIVSFGNCEEVFLQVAKARRVQKFSFDQYQSQGTIQKLHIAGFHTLEMSTVTAMQNGYYTITKLLMDQGLLYLPKDTKWSTTAELELKHIIELPNGKITHKEHGKDLADAICNSVYNCYLYMIQSGKLTKNSSLVSHINTIQTRQPINNSAVLKLKAQSGSALRKLKNSKSAQY